jgi:hypothetical protein
LLRCKGRLENSELTEGARHPILLPNKERLTHLIIERTHKKLLHSGVSQTLSRLRHQYWVIQGRATVKKVLNSCFMCRKVEGGPYEMPKMAPLPRKRVSESTPFTQTGVDYLGPLAIKENSEISKVWICLFTCMVTRAIHMEMVRDMTSVSFMNCLRRFIATRGKPKQILSDNALHFKLAGETCELVWKDVKIPEDIQNYCSEENIVWSFIIEQAPWMGGFYERLVGIVKRALRKTIGKKLLTSDQLQTVIKEAEAVVNSRPLVYVGDDINSVITITPNHFLCLNQNTGIPARTYDEHDPDFNVVESSAEKLLKLWKKGQRLVDEFWKIWRDEYLTSLRERTQTHLKSGRKTAKVLPNIGDIVLVKDNIPRANWKIGKITKLLTSSDGLVRYAKVTLPSGKILGRPLCLLYPIETSRNCDSSDSDSKEEVKIPDKRSVRKASVQAREKIKHILNQ